MKISVIIPVYGVEKYIGRCANSLLNQTFDDVEYIFVDDCTKDNSIFILKEIISHHPDKVVKILSHSINKGLPAARNTGLAQAKGEYIYHCDGDDYLELNALECLYKKAEEEKADIVWCDFYENYSSKQICIKQPDFTDPNDALRAMLTSNMRFNVWNKLCKRALYTEHDIAFLSGNSMGEDMCMMKLFAHARRVSHVSQALYHYIRCNPGAMTKSQTQKSILEDKNNIESLKKHLTKYTGTKFASYIGYHTLWTKLPLLMSSGSEGQYQEWAKWDPDYNSLIEGLPNANKRIKMLMKMGAEKQWWFVWLHHILITKLYYSIRYRKRN